MLFLATLALGSVSTTRLDPLSLIQDKAAQKTTPRAAVPLAPGLEMATLASAPARQMPSHPQEKKIPSLISARLPRFATVS